MSRSIENNHHRTVSHKDTSSGDFLDLSGMTIFTPEGKLSGQEINKIPFGGAVYNQIGVMTGVLKHPFFRFPGNNRYEVCEGDFIPFNFRKEATRLPNPIELSSEDFTVGIEIEGGVVNKSGIPVDVNNGHTPFIPDYLAGRRKELFAATTELAINETSDYKDLVNKIGQSMALETEHWTNMDSWVIWNGILPFIPQMNQEKQHPQTSPHPYVQRMVEYLKQYPAKYVDALNFLNSADSNLRGIDGIYLFLNQGIHIHCSLPTDHIDFAPFAMNFTGGIIADVKAGLLSSTPHWMGKLNDRVDCRWPSKGVLGSFSWHEPYQTWDTEKERVLGLVSRGEAPAISRAWMPRGPWAQHGTDRIRPTFETIEDMRPVTHPVPEAIAAVAITKIAEMWLAYGIWRTEMSGGSLPDSFCKQASKYFGYWGGYPSEKVWIENQRNLARDGEKAKIINGHGNIESVHEYLAQYLIFIRHWTPREILSDQDFEICAEILLSLAGKYHQATSVEAYCDPNSAQFCSGSLGRIVRDEHLAHGDPNNWQIGWQVLTHYAQATSAGLKRFL